MEQRPPIMHRLRRCMRSGEGLAIGVAIGVGIGAALNDLAVGIAIGAGIGVALDEAMVRRNRRG